MQKIPIGLMGCGVVAGYGHLPALKASSELELVSIYDPDEKRLQAARERFSVPNAFSDVDAFFRSGIEAVSLASPAPCHHQNVMDAIRYGKHVLCEKPLAQSEHEAESMVAEMEKANLMLFTAYCYRFSAPCMKIKRLLEQDAVGTVRSLRLIYVWNCHGRYEKSADGTLVEQERRVGRMLEGGPIVDCGVHQIDLSRWWLASEVVAQHSFGAWVENYEAPDHHYLHLEHANGAHSMVEMSFTYCHTAKEPIHFFSYDIIGTDGVIRYDATSKTFELRNLQGTTSFPFAKVKGFDGMYTEFARALTTGESGNLPTGKDGLVATRIARHAVEQAMENRRVV